MAPDRSQPPGTEHPGTEHPGTDPEQIVLVDVRGRPVGTAPKAASHHADTPLHLAFSCYLFNRQGRFLTTRRALSKQVWPGAWSNSLCGHPAPGERMTDAIERRLAYELGMSASALQVVLPAHLYRAPAFLGIVEYEFCPVYVALATGVPRPNPREVDSYAWVDWPAYVRAVEGDTADVYSWWAKNQLRELRAHPLIAAYSDPGRSATGVGCTEASGDGSLDGSHGGAASA